MLGYWRTHQEYQSYLVEKIITFFKKDPQNVIQYETDLSKLYMMDLDTLRPLLDDIHKVVSYYDLINRVWLLDATIQRESNKALHTLTRKPKKKLKKNTKQPPRHPGLYKNLWL